MTGEFSAGGMLVRRLRGRWWLAGDPAERQAGGSLGAAQGLIDPAGAVPPRLLTYGGEREMAE